jgi:hypothetical protein
MPDMHGMRKLSMRILVIEDNHRLNSSLAASLTHEGYSVDSAYDGLEVCRDLRRRYAHGEIDATTFDHMSDQHFPCCSDPTSPISDKVGSVLLNKT